MRRFLLLVLIFTMSPLSAFTAQPVYAVREFADVRITAIHIDRKYFLVELPSGGGSASFHVGPKTWFIKDNEEATLADLQLGQRVHVRFIPRGSQAVTVEVLPPKAQ